MMLLDTKAVLVDKQRCSCLLNLSFWCLVSAKLNRRQLYLSNCHIFGKLVPQLKFTSCYHRRR